MLTLWFKSTLLWSNTETVKMNHNTVVKTAATIYAGRRSLTCHLPYIALAITDSNATVSRWALVRCTVVSLTKSVDNGDASQQRQEQESSIESGSQYVIIEFTCLLISWYLFIWRRRRRLHRNKWLHGTDRSVRTRKMTSWNTITRSQCCCSDST